MFYPSFFISGKERMNEMKMNEKTRKMMLSMAGILVGAWIICTIIVPPSFQYQIMLLVTVVWAAVFILRLPKEKEQAQKPRAMQVIDLEPDYKKLFAQQIQLRVQEKLRNKFPGAVVELCDTEIDRIAAMGKAIYVPIKKADDYCHMSISMRSNGDIQLNLFSLMNLDEIEHGAMKILEEEKQKKELEQWYTQKGQQLLTELITNMNSRGYTKLQINEAGDVTVKENGRQVLKDRFSEIPPKEQWSKLKELMEDDELHIKVSSKQLTLAW